MVYKFTYSIQVLILDLRGLTMSNGYKVHMEVVVLDKSYNFTVNNFFMEIILIIKYTM